MTLCAVVVPMLGRPHHVAPLVESFRSATPEGLATLVFMLSPLDDQVRLEVERAGQDYYELGERPYRGDYARKINAGYRVTEEPFVFTGAGDLHFHAGWLEAALELMSDPRIGVVGTNDLGNPRVVAGRHSTHSLIRRTYADEAGLVDCPGAIYCEHYPHEFVDDELVATAIARRAYAHAPDAVVEHLHPHWGKAPTDELYDQSDERLRRGQDIFRRRRVMIQRVGQRPGR